jgi:hypothetical protein
MKTSHDAIIADFMDKGIMPRAWKQKYKGMISALQERYPLVLKADKTTMRDAKVAVKAAALAKLDPGPYEKVPGAIVCDILNPSVVWARPLGDLHGPWWPGVLIPERYWSLGPFEDMAVDKGEVLVVYLESPSQYVLPFI